MLNLTWIGRNRSLEVSPRARLVEDGEADALRRKLEALQWRPQNGFLRDEVSARLEVDERTDRAA